MRLPWLELLLNAVRGAVTLLGSRWASWDLSRAPHAVDRLPHRWGPALPCLCLATAVPPAAPAQSDGALPRVPTIFRDPAGLSPLTGLSCPCSARDLYLLGLLSCPWGPRGAGSMQGWEARRAHRSGFHLLGTLCFAVWWGVTRSRTPGGCQRYPLGPDTAFDTHRLSVGPAFRALSCLHAGTLGLPPVPGMQ